VSLKLLMPALAIMAASTADLHAQSAAPDAKAIAPAAVPAAAPNGAAQGSDDHIPARTVVEIEITEGLSSGTNNIGDMFALKLAAPLVIDGRTILPAGLVGKGEVTHVGKKGSGGQAGELIVNARYLQCGDLRIPLGHFHYGIAGKNNVGGAFAVAQVIPFGQFLVSGHDAVIPAGASGTAQVNADVTLPAGALGQCAPAAG